MDRKFRKTARRLLALLLVIALLQGFAAAAGSDQMREDYISYLKTARPTDSAVDSLTAQDISVRAYYGVCSGYEIAVLYPTDWALRAGQAEVTVAGCTFRFSSGTLAEMFLAYKDGTFVPVAQAYEQGLLTGSDIRVLWARKGDYPIFTPFRDVSASAWYGDAVSFAYGANLFAGVDATCFGPEESLTRGMLVSVLYRLEGKPAVEGGTSFTDVEPEQYYADAVQWAVAHEIAFGESADAFGPYHPVTREQAVAFLYRYARYKGVDVSTSADLTQFTDLAQLDGYAATAMAWAVNAGLVHGTTTTTLSPKDASTRAQSAVFLLRLCKDVL